MFIKRKDRRWAGDGDDADTEPATGGTGDFVRGAASARAIQTLRNSTSQGVPGIMNEPGKVFWH